MKKKFLEIVEKSSLSKKDKKNIRFIFDYFEGKLDSELSSRSYILYGNTGLGKTYLSKKLILALKKDIIYLACQKFNFGKRCNTINQLIKECSNDKEQVIFIDDLNYHFDKEDFDISPKSKKEFMTLLELIKKRKSKFLLITSNKLRELDSRMINRIEVKIAFNMPSEENKKSFLSTNFKKYLNKNLIDYTANNTIGYNYRDLPEMLKFAYRIGEGKLNLKSIQNALKLYKPSSLYNYNVLNGIKIKMKDIYGKENIVNSLKHTISIYKNNRDIAKLGISNMNMMIFFGPAGTGKTFAARALAGELKFPMISVRGQDLFGLGNTSFEPIINLSKRYKNCVIFIDEAEKLFGNSRFGEDGFLIGEFQRDIDGADGRDIKSIFIMAVNDIDRFGPALRNRFSCIKFDLPQKNERNKFFMEKMKKAKVSFSTSMLVNSTKGMNYREMKRFWNELMFIYFEKKEINQATINKILRGYTNKKPNAMFG